MPGLFRWSIVVLGFAMVVTPAAAQRPGQGKGPKDKGHLVHPKVRHAFRARDRGIFRNYYREHRIVITPLRPEVARLIVIGKPLPIGVVRVALAPQLLILVPPPAPGYQYVIVGNRIVMIDQGGLVDDILDDIFP
jgi:hypothetical protein